MLLATMLLVFGACLWLASGRTPLAIKDHPNERSLHSVPMPHTGGLAILAGIGMVWGWCAGQHEWPTALTWIVFPLVLAGWQTRKVLLIEYAIMIAAGATGVWMLDAEAIWQMVLLCVWVMAYGLFMLAVEVQSSRKVNHG